MRDSIHGLLNFDIDRYLNPWIPPSQLKRLPRPISHWFGYRSAPHNEPPALVQYFWALTGTFLGLLVVGAIYKYAPGIVQLEPPVLIASLGASAVLDYNTIRSPLSQPRNTIVGHTLSAIIGVAISKLFQHNSEFEDLQWVAAALACGIASVVMSATNSVHPPGGATAVLACTEAHIIAMSWWFVPAVLLACCLMLGVALVTNNFMRQYPVYWWSPEEVGQKYRREQSQDEKQMAADHDIESQSDTTLNHERSHGSTEESPEGIHIWPDLLKLPAHLKLTDEEIMLFEKIQTRLA